MSEVYIECLVKAKTKGSMKALSYVCGFLAAIFIVGFFLYGVFWLFLIGLVLGGGSYYLNFISEVEYEYTFFDKELTVDSITGKSKRKTVETFTLDKIEAMAPVKSYHLDDYRNRQVRVSDYSIGEELKPDLRYSIYYEGGRQILISPSEELVKAMKNLAPRKIFND